MTCLQVCWFYMMTLYDQFWRWSSLLNFLVLSIVFFSLGICVWFFMVSVSLLNLPFYSCIVLVILFCCLSVLCCILLSSLSWFFWILCQTVCIIHSIGVGSWSFISFLWWCCICLVLHNLFRFALVSIFEIPYASSSCYKLVSAGKYHLLLVFWADGLPLESQVCWVEAGFWICC